MGSTQQRHRVLAGISRSRLLTVLGRSARPMGVREMADAVSLHPNTVRQHLDQLVEAGLVVRDTAPPAGRGRPILRYAAEPGSDEQDSAAYRALASVLVEQVARLPDGVAAARTAGERWGRTLAHEASDTKPTTNVIGRLVEVLDATGFAPRAPLVDGAPIELHHCPFGTLARDHGEVTCGVHLGLMRGVLRELDAPFDALHLESFVGPSLCLAHLGGRSGVEEQGPTPLPERSRPNGA